jgi:acetyltransferase-like isoleucine patch superfamily enzyme
MSRPIAPFRSHGSGSFQIDEFAEIGTHVIFEYGVLVFHPETIRLGSNIYVGHQTILKGYHSSRFEIGDNTWIGQQCFFHSAGGLRIGQRVGIGPGVRILTSSHKEEGREVPVLFSELAFAPVTIEDDCDLGIGSIVLPGVTVGRGAIVGAGAVVARDVPPYAVVAGVPAKVLRMR